MLHTVIRITKITLKVYENDNNVYEVVICYSM